MSAGSAFSQPNRAPGLDLTSQLVMQMLGMSSGQGNATGPTGIAGLQDLTGRTSEFNTWAQKVLKQNEYYKSMGVKNFLDPKKALLYQQAHGGIPGMGQGQLGSLLDTYTTKKNNQWTGLFGSSE